MISCYQAESCVIIFTVLIAATITTNAQDPSWLWAKATGGLNNDFCNAVTHDALGNVYTTGYFSGTVDFDPGPGTYNLIATPGSVDIFISRLSGSGNFVWAKAIGGAGYDQGQSIDIDASGMMYLVGNTETKPTTN